MSTSWTPLRRIAAGSLLLAWAVPGMAWGVDFTFDSGTNQSWRRVGLYDDGSLNPIAGRFSDDPAGWFDGVNYPTQAFFDPTDGHGTIDVGTGGSQMPPSPTGNGFLHWDLNSPDLSAQADWQSATSFSYDVLGSMASSVADANWVQAVLKVRKSDSTISYYTDGEFRAIPTETYPGFRDWQSYAVDINALAIPAGSTLLNVNMRFFFEPGVGYDGFIFLDNVVPVHPPLPHYWVSPLQFDAWSNSSAWSSGGTPAADWNTYVRNQSTSPAYPVQTSIVDGDFTIEELSVQGVTGLMNLTHPSGRTLDVLQDATFEAASVGSIAGRLMVDDTLRINAGGAVAVATSGDLIADAIHLAGGTLGTTGNAHVYANTLTGFGNTMAIDGNLGIGYAVGSAVGSHTVGAGQRLTISSVLYLGENDATGTLTVANGGQATIKRAVVGAGGVGRMFVDNASVQVTNSTTALYVGEGGAGDGSATVRNHGSLATTDAFLGADVGAAGRLVVQGEGSDFGALLSVYVGGNATSARGAGTLRIADGAAASIGQTLRVYSTGTLEIAGGTASARSVIVDAGGALAHSDGLLRVDGGVFDPGVGASYYAIDGPAGKLPRVTLRNGATLNLSNTLFAGFDHAGELTVESGATVSSFNGRIGWGDAASDGRATVQGSGSQWTNTADLEVGVRRNGALSILSGGRVNNTVGAIGAVAGSHGTALVDAGTWHNNGALYVGGKTAAGGQGELTIRNGGNVEAIGVTAWPMGTITIDDGTLTTVGDVRLAGGKLGGDGAIQFFPAAHEKIVNEGTVAPGEANDPYGVLELFDGDYQQAAGGKLAIDLAGNLAGANLDQLKLTRGSAALGGELVVTLGAGFTPQTRRRYTIVEADGGVSGKFAVENLPSVGGGARLVVDYNGYNTQLLLTYDADFDEDWDVDGADLAAWRSNFGLLSAALHTQGDANRDGAVDGADLLVWQRQLGNGGVSGLQNATTTPEPCGAALLCAAGLLASSTRGFHRPLREVARPRRRKQS